MSKQPVREKTTLLPFTFLDTVGSAIYRCFGEKHEITQKMWAYREKFSARGIFFIKTKKEEKEPAYALTADEIQFLRDSYSKSQEIF